MQRLFGGFVAVALSVGVVVLAGGCGGGSSAPPPPGCAELACNERQVCDVSASPARCKCKEAFSGTTCQSCARGYMAGSGGCVPVDIDCDRNPSVCGTRGTCVQGVGLVEDSCTCQAGYEGHACGSCAPGYLMSTGGVCQPSCVTAQLSCVAPKICSDSTGRATCVCPGNLTGPNCDQCPTGFMLRASDGTCVQTCASLAPTCGTRKRCDESGGSPICVCAAGYSGDSCTACAAGFIADGSGQCVRTAPAGTTLIAGAKFQGADHLVAIDTVAGTATPLRPLAGVATNRLFTDLASRTIYMVSGNTINRLDTTTGVVSPLVTLPSVQSACFGAGAIYSVGGLSPYLLTRINPADGARTDLGPTTLSGSQGQIGLTWSAAGTLLYARPPSAGQTSGAELFQLDASNGTPTMVGPVVMDGARLRPSDARVSLAFDAGGRLFLGARLGRTPEEIVTDHCRRMAAGLGYSDYGTAPFTTLDISQTGVGAGATKVLTSKNTSGPEFVAYASYGQRATARSFVRVETTNPEAFVCLSSYEEPMDLQIPAATARFGAIVLSGYRPVLGLTVEGALPPVTRPVLHVHVASGTVPSVFTAYSFSKVYTATDWTKLTLPVWASAWSTDQNAPGVLMEVDLTTRAVKRVLTFRDVELYPNIAAWAP